MKKTTILPALLAGVIFSSALISCNDDDNMGPIDGRPGTAPDVDFIALTNDGRLINFEGGDLNSAGTITNISGLESNEMLLSIDYRPATGQLYAISSASRLFHINENSGVATLLGTTLSPAVDGDNPSLDFNPTVDRIRLVTETGQNLRLHPELGTVVATDGDINGGMNPRIGAVAYTNSFSGATETTLYDIDFEQDKLYKQTPPNDGGLEEVGNLGIDFEGVGDMDILPDNSVALAVNRKDDESRLYTINLQSGAAAWVGTFSQPVISIAFKTNPIAYAADASNKLYRFDPTNPNPIAVDFSGLADGETILGLDFRPANGQLLAISSRNQLYSVNPSNGALAAIGSPLSPGIMGNLVGFDFNPTVDRIRLVTERGQNLRLHPDLGTVVFVDGNLNPGSPMVSGAAYTENFAGTTSTLLYVLDSGNGMLYTQNPPNDGTLVEVGPTGVSFEGENGFDIGGTSNAAYAALTVGGASGVYSINLTSGAATKVADLNFTPTAMALGLGF